MVTQAKTVLALKDEKSLMAAIKAKLELKGFSVVSARSANQALGYLKEGTKVDAVWLDHYLFGKKSGLGYVLDDRHPPTDLSNR